MKQLIPPRRDQKTTVPSGKDLAKKWFLVDVKGLTLGLLAVKIADTLRGKRKVFFTPQHDCGDYVVVINARHVRLSGGKMDSKMYQWHTKYPGGFREQTARQILAKKPEKVLYDAVRGMLPRNKLRKKIMKKLRVFPEAEHKNAAQNPIKLEL